MTRTELNRAVKLLHEDALKNKVIPDDTTLSNFMLRFTHPELLLGENNSVIMDYYTQLHLLMLPPDIRPVLEAGNHRRAALARLAEKQLDQQTKQALEAWPHDYSQPAVQHQVEKVRPNTQNPTVCRFPY